MAGETGGWPGRAGGAARRVRLRALKVEAVGFIHERGERESQ